MSIRSVIFAPALFVGALAGVNLAAITDLRAQVITTAEAAIQAPPANADSCLTAPKGATPAGSHWYYRLDRVTKRQCWYLREESDASEDKFTRAAPPVSAPAPAATADESTPAQRTISRKAIADARAEWVAQQPRAEANPPARVERMAAAAAPAPVVADSPRIAMPNVLTPAPLSSVRWDDATPKRASVDRAEVRLAAANPPAAQPQLQPTLAEEVQPPVAEPVVPFATDAATAKPTASLQKLLLVMAAALALAGVTVSAIVRIGRMRARRAMHRKRRAMWDSAKTKTRRRAPQPQQQPQPQPAFRDESAPIRRAAAAQQTPRTAQQEKITRAPRERPRAAQERPYAPQERRHAPQDRMPQDRVAQDRMPQDRAPQERDRERQVTEMLSRLARSAQN
jgi:hypothetical protein